MEIKAPAENEVNTRVLLKNVFMISISFMLLFTSFTAIENLQSSVNKFLGIHAMLAIYIPFFVSCMFATNVILETFSMKWSLCVFMFSYSAYIGAQLCPSYYTLLPTAVMVGFSAAPLWAAQSTYITEVSKLYADKTKEDTGVVATKLFSIFVVFFNISRVAGNLITSTVISKAVDLNETERGVDFKECGIAFCPSTLANLTSLPSTEGDVDQSSIIGLLSIIFLVISLVAPLLVAFCVDHEDTIGGKAPATKESYKKHVLGTINHLRNVDQILLVPITIFCGLQSAFVTSDFTMAYVTCSVGLHMVGYVMVCAALFNILFTVGMAAIVKRVGRLRIVLMSFGLYFSLLVGLLTWRPAETNVLPWLLVAAAVFGLSNAVWQTQSLAIYAVTFPESSRAAFSNYHMWKSCGFMIAFAISGVLCMKIKVYVHMTVLIMAVLGYVRVVTKTTTSDLKINGLKITKTTD